MSISICHVGGEDVRFRIPMLVRLRSQGFTVSAIGSEEGDAFEDVDIPYHRYNLYRGFNPVRDFRSVRKLKDILRHVRPDIAHAFDTKPGLLVPSAGRSAGICGIVRTVTGMGFVFSSSAPLALALRPIYRLLQKRASALSDRTVFQNQDDMGYFLEHGMTPAHKALLVPGSGVEEERFSSATPEEKAALRRELNVEGSIVVTMVSRLTVSKGVRELLDAAACVRRRRPDVRFLLVGPLATEVNEAVGPELLESSSSDVMYLGSRGDVPLLLQISDIFVLPSYYREGIPRVLLESASAGLPLITTDAPGCRDVVKNDWNGRLVPPRDAQSLADAILSLVSSEGERRQMGARSRDLIRERFSLDTIVAQYAGIYHSIAEGKGQSKA